MVATSARGPASEFPETFDRRTVACKRLGVSTSTLDRMVAGGILPPAVALYPGSRIRGWPSKILDRFILSREEVSK